MKTGATPPRGEPAYWNGDIPWFSAKDLKAFWLHDSQEHISQRALENRASLLPKGAILILVRGMTLLKYVPLGVTTRPVAINQDLRALLPVAGIDPAFLGYAINARRDNLRAVVDRAGHGTGRLATQHLRDLSLLIPDDIREQREIAKALTLWDEAGALIRRLILTKRHLKRGLMQRLLTAPEDATRTEWQEVPLGHAAKVIMGTSPPSAAYNRHGNGLPLLQGNADIEGGVSRPRVCTTVVTQECIPEDILLSVRAPIGELARSAHHACVGRGICAIRAKSGCSQEYLYQALLAAEPRWHRVGQGSTFTALTGSEVRGFLISMPIDLDIQVRIAGVLRALDIEIRILERQRTLVNKQRIALMDRLLTGKLRLTV